MTEADAKELLKQGGAALNEACDEGAGRLPAGEREARDAFRDAIAEISDDDLYQMIAAAVETRRFAHLVALR